MMATATKPKPIPQKAKLATNTYFTWLKKLYYILDYIADEGIVVEDCNSLEVIFIKQYEFDAMEVKKVKC